ncbi:MAG TPA: hypothetical protein PKX05_00960, partial [bacterium]|nr:hypothetical protein [bacterium]
MREKQKQLVLEKKRFIKEQRLLAAKQKSEKILREKAQKQYQQQLKIFTQNIFNSANNISRLAETLLSSAVMIVSRVSKKARSVRIPSVKSFAPEKIIPAKKAEAISPITIVVEEKKKKKYREPVKLGPLLRKNAFRLLFIFFLLIWFGEILYYSLGWKPPREKFEEMFGEIEKLQDVSKKPEPAETASLSIPQYKVPSVNIEGKRDPFSSGTLTMELMKKPSPTQIARIYRPEIITIKPTPILVVPELTGQEKDEGKSPRGKFEKITPILKPEKPEISEISTAALSNVVGSNVLHPEKVSKPQTSPLIIPQVECPLVYRGSLVMEGIEYIFIEGKQRTYRVTVGDMVEGFRIL